MHVEDLTASLPLSLCLISFRLLLIIYLLYIYCCCCVFISFLISFRLFCHCLDLHKPNVKNRKRYLCILRLVSFTLLYFFLFLKNIYNTLVVRNWLHFFVGWNNWEQEKLRAKIMVFFFWRGAKWGGGTLSMCYLQKINRFDLWHPMYNWSITLLHCTRACEIMMCNYWCTQLCCNTNGLLKNVVFQIIVDLVSNLKIVGFCAFELFWKGMLIGKPIFLHIFSFLAVDH